MSKHGTREACNSVQQFLQWIGSLRFDFFKSGSWRRHAPGGGKSALAARVCIACIPGLIIGLTAFIVSVGPLEKRLLQLEADGLARDIDAVVNLRAAAIRIAAGEIGTAGLHEAGALNNLLDSFRRSFADFLSLEILDPHGEAIAMAGELPLSQARRFSGDGGAERPPISALNKSQAFQDDPAADNFHITVRLEAKDGTEWYSRARFSRESIKKILSAGGGRWTAGLEKISDEEANTGKYAGAPSGTFSSVWPGRDAAVVPLHAAGWIVKLEKPSKGL
ncbi:MAG: hypothetical protein V1792_15230, partial [Pseudomonadota bacterium]